jgi:nucleoside-diphosphate-sugar epimerase
MTVDNRTQTVLVTGASGFVATHVVSAFLSAGYHVRGTVRSESKAKSTAAIFPSDVQSRLSFVVVEDIAVPGAFDEAVKDVDGVIHTASPFILQAKDNKRDLLDPAINGTLNILKAIQKHGTTAKRLVVTSSFAAILDLSKGNRPGYTYTEKDWNPATYEEALKSDNGAFVYCASKKLAEKTAYDFVESEKPNFSIATICPPMVYGPAIQPIHSLSSLNESIGDIYRFMNGSTPKVQVNGFWAFVDVRDVAQAHLKAYEHPEGGRFFVTGGIFTYQQVVKTIRNVPGVDQSKVSKDDPSLEWPETYKVDNSKSRKELGIEFRSLEESIRDTALQMLHWEQKLGNNEH